MTISHFISHRPRRYADWGSIQGGKGMTYRTWLAVALGVIATSTTVHADHGAPLRILYAPAADLDQAFVADLAMVANATVDYFDARVDTPSFQLMLKYDGVFTWREDGETYAQPAEFGDRLALAADNVRCVVLGYGCALPGGLTGLIMSSSYCPVDNPTLSANFLPATPNMGQTCIWTGGPVIPSMSVDQHEVLVLQGVGKIDGTWNETGEIAAAFMDANNDNVPAEPAVIYLNGAKSGSGTDIPCWIAGAFACHHATPPDCPEDLTGDALVSTEDLLLLLGLWGEVNSDADFDESGEVDTGDLLVMLAGWGECQAP